MNNTAITLADDDYMNDAQLAYFKQTLIQEKKRLLEQSETQMGEVVGSIEHQADPMDKASSESDAELARFRRAQTLRQINTIDKALKALSDDEYGYCRACGVEIGLPRLNANPAALECIDCQSLDEIKNKH